MLSRLLNKFKGGKSGPASGDDATVVVPGQPAPVVLPPIPTWEPGDVIMERYRVEQVMAGSMGKIYICDHLGWGIPMAVKSPRPEVLADREGMKRILTEANSWIRMGMHPNIATCYYVLSLNKIPHLFIEYIDGGSLTDWIDEGRCRNLRTALSLAIQFCHGMEYTHAKGIIHRDIKPHNILVTKNSLVKITDFGILLSAENRGEAQPGGVQQGGAEDATVGFRGTPGYASPEQFRNAHNVDQRTDIYSFGLCLWLMLCGKKPFKDNRLKAPIPAPTPVAPKVVFPPVLKKALKKCVAFTPEERYQSFAELRADLNEAYTAAFNAACPYAEIPNIDLRADFLNNRAVSLIELGEVKEGGQGLQQTIDVNDMLPEAIYNTLLFRWRFGKSPAERILRQVEATRRRTPNLPGLDELEAGLKREVQGQKAKGYPEFRLCVPKTTLEVFREGQLQVSVQRNIQDHLENKRYKACHDVLMTAWGNIGFRKDKLYNHVYERLLWVGQKERVTGAQRFLSLKGYGCPATSLAHIPKSRRIVAAGDDGQVILRDLGGKHQVAFFGQGKPVKAMVTCPKGTSLAVGTEDGQVKLLTPSSGKVLSTEQNHKGAVTALAFSPNAKYLASGGADAMLKIRKLGTGPETSVSVQEGGAVRSLLFLEKGLDLVTGSDDGKIRFWQDGGKECTRILEAHAMPVTALSLTPDGRTLASASPDRHLKIWERQTGRCLKTIKAHEETITSVLALADNRTIVTGCEDDIVKLWDTQSGECLLTLDGRGDGIHSLAQGPRPHTFLAGRNDGGITLWMVIYRLSFE
ncbi:MAG TPA: serine/threonine-protein kinase [Desulfurivibrionaceae bacterium]|nr:serine/threonine-protein kinase [Desulfurivibrionaceae bacterium]